MRPAICCVILALVGVDPTHAATAYFPFGASAAGIDGLATGVTTRDGVAMTLSATPAGALLFERGSQGMGIDSRGVAGATGNEIDKFDVVRGLDNVAEGIEFSFDQPGLLTRLNFDGVKDESLEHFVLTSASGLRLTFFDSAANTTIPGAVDAAIAAGAVVGPVVYLLEISATIDDESNTLTIPFVAGERFTLTYGELAPRFGTTEAGNGARLQGVGVTIVPEPSSATLGAAALTLLRRRGAR
ncbi:MAG: hypothetical protein ACRCT8_13075 [Lacipirellulaceae bacterium]